MPEEPEIETQDLQEHVSEAHEHAAREGAGWTKYVALSTAAFAAFAAVGALHAGSLVNRAMMDQIRAADAWNEYQADKQKSHSYTIEANRLRDAGVTPTVAPARPEGAGEKPKPTKKAAKAPERLTPEARLADYESEIGRENEKSAKLAEDAKRREEMAEAQLDTHERFAYSVALLQVAIALGAVSAIARSKPVWVASAVVGAIGIVFFVIGFVK